MEITGHEYLIISNTKPKKVAKNFKKNLKSIWSKPIIFEVEELHEFNQDAFFYTYVKNKKMDLFFEENAYILNDKGEGAFALTCMRYNKVTVNSTSNSIEFDDNKNKEKNIPYNIHLSNTFLYCLVLPSTIEHNFCQNVIHLLNESF